MNKQALTLIEEINKKLVDLVFVINNNKEDSPDSEPMNAEEIAWWAFEDVSPSDGKSLINKINALVQYELKKANQ
jgi:hypothetical protein